MVSYYKMAGNEIIKHRKTFFIFIIVFLVLLPISESFAQPATKTPKRAGFAVIPTKIQLTLPPGARQTVKLTVINDDPLPHKILLEAWDFARDAKGNPYPIGPRDVKTFRGASDWVTFPPPGEFQAKSRESVEVSFDVSIPRYAPWGTHYTYIRVTGMPMVKKRGQVLINYEINALLLVTVGSPTGDTPTLKRSASLNNFLVSRINYTSPVLFTTKINNKGNVHLNFVGQILIKSGKTLIKRLPIREYTLLPFSPTVFTTVWEDPPLFGRFKAELTGDTGLEKPFKAEKQFWVISRKLIIWMSIAILAALAALIFVLRKFKIQLIRRG